MTKEITKARIIQEIQDKFKLREFSPEKFLFNETVVPIYNVEPHLGKWEIKRKTTSITSISYPTFFTVPESEKWTIRAYQPTFMTGSYSIAGVLVGRPDATTYIYLDLKAAQNVSYVVNLPVPVIVQPGEVIFVNVDGYTTTGDLLLHMDVMVEEIR